ncbi:SDR family NAD(P)-dependent oxidoreductase [Methylomicrobium lacus]|uniref:SDR family NAD(P)-dependent oxidoreductase n=1 Tax=Methylomicrobium lacus TaxID=136992 RepID=UPI00045EBDB6|nr:SDR family NAD(P)-dependent oxidoreductase [Methylomicrobium lacus]
MKTLLITGSTSGIGMAVCKALAERGAELVLHYHANQEKADALADWLDTKGCVHSFYQADLTRPENAKAFVDHALARFGRIDGLINVVGPYVYKNILEVTPEDWLADIDLNLNCCFHTSYYALEALRNSQGQIVNFAFAGVENIKPWPMSAGYSAAKTGVAALTKSLAVALAPDKVRVNAICPGLTEDEDINAEERQAMAAQIPYGRPVQPDEIGNTVAWLLYDSPEMMTGSLLTLAGGWEY